MSTIGIKTTSAGIKTATTGADIKSDSAKNDDAKNLQYALVGDMSWRAQANWQTPDTPFMMPAFWQALIDTGAIGEAAGWLPIYIVAYEALNTAADDDHQEHDVTNMTPLAVMPVFVKGHHRGEFVFDHSWAQAYAQYGLDYYPRLVTSVPYTPITGQRIWLASGTVLNTDIVQTLINGVDDIARQVGASSWHGLFVTPELTKCAAALNDNLNPKTNNHTDIDGAIHDGAIDNSNMTQNNLPIMQREGCQFLWQNKNLSNNQQPFTDFDDFLATLTAKKRKNIRAERRKVAAQGITCTRKCGMDISEDDWQVFYHCYVMTYAVRGQSPYLTLDFFKALAASMPEHLMLAQALDGDDIVASSLFLYDSPNSDKSASLSAPTTLYGRYWGALDEYDSLHFELCYYQGIEFAIECGLESFDPGTQGEHKLIRGFIPTTTHSLHRIYDARFVPAIDNFCSEDRARMAYYRAQAFDALPFNRDNMPKFQPNE